MSDLPPAQYMQQVVSDLRRGQQNAAIAAQSSTVVSVGSWDVIGSQSSKDADVGAIERLSNDIDTLESESSEVLDGSRTMANWKAYASTIWDSPKSFQSNIGDFGAYGVLEQTYAATKDEVVKDVKEAAVIATPFAAIAVCLVVLYVLILVRR